MLVLGRRPNEKLMIRDDVTVTVLGVKGNHVRIGIDAPQETVILREEVLLKIKEQERLAEQEE